MNSIGQIKIYRNVQPIESARSPNGIKKEKGQPANFFNHYLIYISTVSHT